MADQPIKRQLPPHNKSNRLILQIHRRAVGSDQRFLINANRSRIERRLTVLGLRKEQNSPPGSYSLHGSPNQAVAADRQNGRVGASTLSLPAYLLGRVGTRHVD